MIPVPNGCFPVVFAGVGVGNVATQAVSSAKGGVATSVSGNWVADTIAAARCNSVWRQRQ